MPNNNFGNVRSLYQTGFMLIDSQSQGPWRVDPAQLPSLKQQIEMIEGLAPVERMFTLGRPEYIKKIIDGTKLVGEGQRAQVYQFAEFEYILGYMQKPARNQAFNEFSNRDFYPERYKQELLFGLLASVQGGYQLEGTQIKFPWGPVVEVAPEKAALKFDLLEIWYDPDPFKSFVKTRMAPQDYAAVEAMFGGTPFVPQPKKPTSASLDRSKLTEDQKKFLELSQVYVNYCIGQRGRPQPEEFWEKFEDIIVGLFAWQGWEVVELPKRRKDGGSDGHIRYYPPGTTPIDCVIQTKYYDEAKVGILTVRAFIGTIQQGRTNDGKPYTGGIFVTDSDFTRDVKDQANELQHKFNIELYDHDRLYQAVKNIIDGKEIPKTTAQGLKRDGIIKSLRGLLPHIIEVSEEIGKRVQEEPVLCADDYLDDKKLKDDKRNLRGGLDNLEKLYTDYPDIFVQFKDDVKALLDSVGRIPQKSLLVLDLNEPYHVVLYEYNKLCPEIKKKKLFGR